MIEHVAFALAHDRDAAFHLGALLDDDPDQEWHLEVALASASFYHEGGAAQLPSGIEDEGLVVGQLRADAQVVHPGADSSRRTRERARSSRLGLLQVDANAAEPFQACGVAQLARLSARAQIEWAEG